MIREAKFKGGDILVDRSTPSIKRIIKCIDPPGRGRDSDIYGYSTYVMRPYPGEKAWQNFSFEYVEGEYRLDEESMVDRVLTKYSNEE